MVVMVTLVINVIIDIIISLVTQVSNALTVATLTLVSNATYVSRYCEHLQYIQPLYHFTV